MQAWGVLFCENHTNLYNFKVGYTQAHTQTQMLVDFFVVTSFNDLWPFPRSSRLFRKIWCDFQLSVLDSSEADDTLKQTRNFQEMT